MKIIKTGIEEREEECWEEILILGWERRENRLEVGNDRMEDRRSKDKTMNAEGRKLTEELKKKAE